MSARAWLVAAALSGLGFPAQASFVPVNIRVNVATPEPTEEQEEEVGPSLHEGDADDSSPAGKAEEAAGAPPPQPGASAKPAAASRDASRQRDKTPGPERTAASGTQPLGGPDPPALDSGPPSPPGPQEPAKTPWQPEGLGPPTKAAGATGDSIPGAKTGPEILGQRGSKIEGRAKALGERIKKSFSGEDLPTGTAGGAPRGAALGESPLGLDPRAGAGDPTNPVSKEDLLLASVAGFGASFQAMGLKAGRGSGGVALILRRDGSHASAAELSSLAGRIRSEPVALMRRPDFFQVLPRERFDQLKDDYRPEAPPFRHVALSLGKRDFLFGESCQRLSGECNSFVEESSYRKREEVSPESLDSLWAAVRSGRLEADEEPRDREDDADAAHARRMLSRSAFKEKGPLSSLLSFAGSLWPGASSADRWSKEEAGAGPAAGRASRTASGRAQGARPGARPGRAPAAPPPSAPPPARRGWAEAAGAGLLLLVAIWLLRRWVGPSGDG